MFSCYLVSACYRRTDICIFKSSVLDFSRNSAFGFYLVNSKCGAYLAVDHSLVYSYPKWCLLVPTIFQCNLALA